LNGKLCRLRDIQDIFMGTGLGPESYRIIGQERIGQLLARSRTTAAPSSKRPPASLASRQEAPRRTAFGAGQAKPRPRVNDIFEEVTRQMGSLKRQAAKAERYGALRDEMRARLKVVLASKIAQMDTEQATLQSQIGELTTQIDDHSQKIESLDGEHAMGVTRGYDFDAKAKEAATRAQPRAQSIWNVPQRVRQRTRSVLRNSRPAQPLELPSLNRPKPASRKPDRRARRQRAFLESAASEAANFRQQAQAKQQKMREAADAVNAVEQRSEASRRQAMQLLSQVGQIRNQTAQSKSRWHHSSVKQRVGYGDGRCPPGS